MTAPTAVAGPPTTALPVKRSPLAGGRTVDRQRKRLVCGGAAALIVWGLGTALYYGVAPTAVTVHEAVNVVEATGTEGSTLVVSDRTRSVTRTVSCVPLSSYDDSANQEGACRPKARQRLQVAGFGLAVFVAGIALWIIRGGDRYLGISRYRTYAGRA